MESVHALSVVRKGLAVRTESDLTRWFCRQLQDVGVRTVAIVGGQMQPAGLPDRYLYGPRVPGLWLEFKRGSRKLTALQRVTMLDLIFIGVPALVVRFLEDDLVQIEVPTRNAPTIALVAFKVLRRSELGAEMRDYLLDAVQKAALDHHPSLELWVLSQGRRS